MDHQRYLEIGAGPILSSDRGFNSPGFTSHVALGYTDWVALVSQFELIPYARLYFLRADVFKGGTETSFYGGLRFSSYPGAVLGISSATILLVIIVAVTSSWGA